MYVFSKQKYIIVYNKLPLERIQKCFHTNSNIYVILIFYDTCIYTSVNKLFGSCYY